MVEEHDSQHWEILIETIVDRIGVEAFLDTTAYVLHRKHDEHPCAIHLDEIADKVEDLIELARVHH